SKASSSFNLYGSFAGGFSDAYAYTGFDTTVKVALFFGGDADGFAQSVSRSTPYNAYAGDIADGFASNKLDTIEARPLFFGGDADGFAKKVSDRLAFGSFMGGFSDAYATTSYEATPTTEQFFGGIADGFASKMQTREVDPVYAGGENDGFSALVAPCADFDSLVVSNNGPVCPGDTLFLYISTDLPQSAKFTWRGKAFDHLPGGVSNQRNPYIYPFLSSYAGMYKVSVNPGCPESNESLYPYGTTIVEALPQVNTVVRVEALPNFTVCDDQEIKFEVTGSGWGENPSFEWRTGMTNLVVDSTAPNDSLWQYGLIPDGMKVQCWVTSSEKCVSMRKRPSNIVHMNVQAYVDVKVKIASTFSGNDSVANVCEYANSTTLSTLQHPEAGYMPTYQWYKNGKILSGETRYTLTINHPVHGDTFQLLVHPSILCPVSKDVWTNKLIIKTIAPPAYHTDSVIRIIKGDYTNLIVYGKLKPDYTYLWSSPFNGTYALSNRTKDTAIANPGVKTPYDVKVTNIEGCYAYDTTIV
ncbi:MAG: hypothetical protein RR256_07205, partial [Bacteroidales bacterium]